MEIREVKETDLNQLLELYAQLHGDALPKPDDAMEQIWQKIFKDENHHIIVGFIAERLVSSCDIIIVPNLTHNHRPYAVVENVVTHEAFRNRGYGTQILGCAKEIAVKNNCYKIMLLTGSKKDSTLKFYEKAGYNKNDKTAFIQWLDCTV